MSDAAETAANGATNGAAGTRPRRERRGAPRPPAKPFPWLDRGGRFSPFKSAVFALTILPGLLTGVRWIVGDLGGEPYMEATHQTGLWAIRFLLISLAVTPLRYLLDWPGVVVLRRMLGLAGLAYALVHFLLYVIDQKFNLFHVVSEIVLRLYLTIGFVALAGLCVLGWTSTDAALRRMGRRWKQLHRLVFPIVVLAALHFYMQSKVDVSEAVMVSGFFLWLVFWRLLPATRRASIPVLLLLVPAAALGAAALEYAWYALATRVPAILVLKANLGFDLGPRPAVWVAMAAVVAALLPLWPRLRRRVSPTGPATA
ncbi:protein-methionine-sulfoxide reductase heme-binding subunit MsrQ [Roseomonas elaeocarpi]|uniref:Protein-methionine-sulfoxide reductase heme-binding subunit MsrQ n=1 Tax=Roseomonas elaeocarpi TaxID=907779 RepID=A0ABV6JWN1_9PROT